MSTVLVVGASSALAQAAIERLRADHEVVTAGRSNCDIQLDLAQPITLPQGIDVVVNFAAAFGGADDDATLDTLQTNVVGAFRLCMAARRAGVRHFVQISSMSAVHASDSPYYSDYAITKRQADELLEWYCKSKQLPLTILRPSQLYGDSPLLSRHQPFFYRIIDAAEQGEDITIYGTHDALRNYLHVSDFSEIVARVIADKVKGTYPCLYPEDVTYSCIAQTAQRVFAKGGNIRFLEDRPDTPDNVFAMDLTIYDRIGFRPQVTLEAGIASIKAYRERKNI